MPMHVLAEMRTAGFWVSVDRPISVTAAVSSAAAAGSGLRLNSVGAQYAPMTNTKNVSMLLSERGALHSS